MSCIWSLCSSLYDTDGKYCHNTSSAAKNLQFERKKKNSMMLWALSRARRGLLTLLKCRKNVGLQLPENSLHELGIRQHLFLLRFLAVWQEALSTGLLKKFWGIYSLKGVCTAIIFILTLLGGLAYFNISAPFSVQLLLSGLGSLKDVASIYSAPSKLRAPPKVCKQWVTGKSMQKTILASLNKSVLF